MPLPAAQELRRLVVAAILATDMQAHLTITSEFCRHAPGWSPDSLEDRLMLVKTIVHAADLANPTRPFPINCFMSACIHAEFSCAPPRLFSPGQSDMCESTWCAPSGRLPCVGPLSCSLLCGSRTYRP